MSKFTCGVRVTCAKCGHCVCANPEHPEYAADLDGDPIEAMREHKETNHG